MLIDRLAASLSAAEPYATITELLGDGSGRHARRARAHPSGGRRRAARPGAAADARGRVRRGERRALLAPDRRVPRPAARAALPRAHRLPVERHRARPRAGRRPCPRARTRSRRTGRSSWSPRRARCCAWCRRRAAASSTRSSLGGGRDARPRGGRGAPRAHGLRARRGRREPRAVRGSRRHPRRLPGRQRSRRCARSSSATRSRRSSATCPRPARPSATPSPSRSSPAANSRIGSRGVEFAQKTLRDKALKDPFLAHDLELLEQGVFFNGIERLPAAALQAPRHAHRVPRAPTS